jgi:hypothetical protein
MAVTVRALATNQITASNTWRTIVREIRVAFLNGATVAVVIGIGVALVFSNPALGGVIAAAMLTNIVTAGVAGAAIPLIFDRYDADPAVASSIFVTMITDSMGFFAFLGLATLAGLTAGAEQPLLLRPFLLHALHLTKIAFGCDSVADLAARLQRRAEEEHGRSPPPPAMRPSAWTNWSAARSTDHGGLSWGAVR